MNSLYIVGSEKFAFEVADYIENSVGLDGSLFSVDGFFSLAWEKSLTPADRTERLNYERLREVPYLALGVSDVDARAKVIETIPPSDWPRFPALVHCTASVARSARLGEGVIVGPMCRVGANSNVGPFCVLNYLCSVSHHSVVGMNTFLTPGFQCGNSVDLGGHSLYGVSSVVGPQVRVGAGARVQAGTAVLENVGPDMSVFSSNRQRIITRGGV